MADYMPRICTLSALSPSSSRSLTISSLTHLVGFVLKLRNLGVSDHGLVRELSTPLAGSLYGGEGHSRIYEDPAVYEYVPLHFPGSFFISFLTPPPLPFLISAHFTNILPASPSPTPSKPPPSLTLPSKLTAPPYIARPIPISSRSRCVACSRRSM